MKNVKECNKKELLQIVKREFPRVVEAVDILLDKSKKGKEQDLILELANRLVLPEHAFKDLIDYLKKKTPTR